MGFPIALVIGAVAAAASPAGSLKNAAHGLVPGQDASSNTRYTATNWTDDFSDYTFKNLGDGEFTVEWDNGFGGYFVSGVGYTPSEG
jgi:hypothetical protein